ncbi:Glyoxylate reductase [Nitrospina gracilis 3/211]|uniref:Glyoxylate reductase n=1 Tax=Nitrospina gracilis (strain 3/211) TaxID=1266370 RepID=M1YJD8_NITG3|nr:MULTISPECIES: D-glycerate dehydrogenase [Nitrospina]MCF8723559.1 glyoxylate reductase [Nitrospina sp. Nb-3]CCQ90632.1 Glyoxylate reductase [Nitrospina gracilis 3/211]
MKPVVTVTNIFSETALERLRQRCHVVYNDSGASLPVAELKQRAAESDAMVTYLSDRIDSEVLGAGNKLKLVANYGAGFNNIDVARARQNQIWVTNTPGVLHETTADLTWALMLGIARAIVPADRYTREGHFTGWQAKLFLGHDVYGKTLGVIGCGEIGRAVARRALGFDMKVLYCQRNRLPEEQEQRLNAAFVPLEQLLRESDFVTLHVPLTEETRYMIRAEQIAMMKPTAYLINTARGKVMDDRALVEALKKGTIAGAALDVFENEPELTEGMTELNNILIPPHIGSASHATREVMANLVVDNVFDALDGATPRTLVPGWNGG